VSDLPVVVIGGGPAGLSAAEVITSAGHAVELYDAMPSVGRKFLMAGKGGLNLTHSEPLEAFLGRFGAARPRLEALLRAFGPEALRQWAHDLGVETFVGTSGRVFPRDMRPRRCCAPGCIGYAAQVCGCILGTAGWAGMENGFCASPPIPKK